MKTELDIKYIDENYGRQLYVVALSIVNDYEMAKDVMQDSLVKIWKNQHKFNKGKGALWTWMRSIVSRTAIDHFRTRASNRRFLASPSEAVFSAGTTSINIDTLDIQSNISKLKLKNAFIIRKIYIEGFSEIQVSENYNIPLGTVKSRKKIGLRNLRLIYKN